MAVFQWFVVCTTRISYALYATKLHIKTTPEMTRETREMTRDDTRYQKSATLCHKPHKNVLEISDTISLPIASSLDARAWR